MGQTKVADKFSNSQLRKLGKALRLEDFERENLDHLEEYRLSYHQNRASFKRCKRKEGVNDVSFVLETRLEVRQPIAVTSQADSIEKAVSEATDKMKAAITTVIGKSQTH